MTPTSLSECRSEQWGRIDSCCARFELACRQGESPDPAEWVAAAPEEDRVVLVRELIRVELEQRRARGEVPGVEDYRWAAELYPSANLSDLFTEPGAGGTGLYRPVPGERVVPAIPGYQLLEFLGRGGMGDVWQAEDLATGRMVALKILRADRLEQRVRFDRDARSLARLGDITGVVRVWAVGAYDGRPFFTMEFCAGQSLKHQLVGGPLDPSAAARLLHWVAAAVHEVHARGIIHRDLSPANILFARDRTPKLTDFGLAKFADETLETLSGVVMGTIPYLAPEQAAGNSRIATAGTDVYALGAILYECLTGRPPFRAASTPETLRQICEDDPVPPTRLNRAIPADLGIICLKCLNKQVGDRYSSAAHMAEDLNCFLTGEPLRHARLPTMREEVNAAERKARLAIETALGMAEAVLTLEARFNPVRLEFLRVARDFLAELCRPEGGTAADRATVADAYRRVAEIDSRLGRHAQAETDLRRAVSLARELIQEHPAKASFTRLLVRACTAQAHTCAETGRYLEADELFTEALHHAEAVFRSAESGTDPAAPVEDSWTALVLSTSLDLGKLRHVRGRTDEAERFYGRALELSAALRAHHPGESYPVFCAALSHYHLGLCYEFQRESARADAHYQDALALLDHLADAPPVPGQATQSGFTALDLRPIEQLVPITWDHRPLSENLYYRAVEVLEKVQRRFPDAPGVRRILAIRRSILASFLHSVDRVEEAEREFRAAIAAFEELCRTYPDLLEYPHELAHTHVYFAQLLLDRGRTDEAVATYHQAVAIFERLLARAPAVTRYAQELADIRNRLDKLLAVAGPAPAPLTG
jgi:tetratricopeptide (TPR) repeat protein